MAQTVKLKRTSVAGRNPTTSNIEVGELAFNSNDKSLFIRGDSSAIVTLHDESTLHINNTNNRVGIGTTSPSTALHMSAADGSAELILARTGSEASLWGLKPYNSHFYIRENGTDRVTILSGGAVGIGTTSPDRQLEVEGQAVLRLNATGSYTDPGIDFNVGSSNEMQIRYRGNPDKLQIYSYGTTSNVVTVQKSNGYVGIGTESPSGTLHVVGSNAIIDTADGSGLTINRPGNSAHIHLFPAYSSVPTIMGQGAGGLHLGYNSSTAGIRINTSNNVGIGTTSPTELLHVKGTNGAIAIDGNGSSNTASIKFINDNERSRITSAYDTGGGGRLTFHTDTTGGSLVERLRIDNAGNVGIGVTSPSNKLDVAGDIKSTTNIISDIFKGATHGSHSFLDFDDDNPADGQSNSVTLASVSSMNFLLDTNNNSDNDFSWVNGNQVPSSGTKLMALNQEGHLTLVHTSAKLGVGVAAPSTKLHVKDATDPTIRVEDTDSGMLVGLQSNGSTGFVGTTTNSHFAIRSNNTERIKVLNTGAVSFNGAYTFPTADGSNGQVLKTDGSGNLTFQNDSGGGGASTSISDADSDTKIQVEESSDEDIIRFDSGGEEVAKMQYRNNEVFLDLRRRGVNAYANLSFSGLGLNTNTPAGYHPLVVQVGGTEKFRVASDGNATFANNLTVTGNLTVNGTQTTLNTATLDVEDLNITVAKGAADAAAANGAGLTVDGASANITYTSSTDEWDFNKSIDINGGSGTGLKIHSGGAIVGAKSGGDTQLMYWGGSVVYYGRSTFGGTVTGHEFRIGGTTKLNVNSSGNTIASGKVGIGTSAPASALDVKYDQGNLLNLYRPNSSTSAASLLDFSFNTANGTEAVYARIRADVEVNTNSGQGGDLTFHTANSGSVAEKMRITQEGNVGIGVTDPTSKLDIRGSGDVDIMSKIINTGQTTNGRKTEFLFGKDNGANLSGVLKYVYNSTQASRRIDLVHYGTSNGLSILDGGNVGVGTTTPAALFNANSSSTIGWSNLANAHILAGTTTGGIGIDTNEIAVKGDHVYFGTIDAKDIVFRTNGANHRMRILSAGQIAINADSARTTGGTAQVTIAGSSSLINMGPSNSDNMYIRRMGAGLFQMQTYNNNNTGHIELEPYGGNVGIGTAGTSPAAKLHLVNDATTDALLLESTEASSSAAPVLAFKRNSSSVANADYLGQLKFKGENDANQEVVYAKITAKILDDTDGTEDGLIEFANKKAGSNEITARLRSDSLQLLNDTSLALKSDGAQIQLGNDNDMQIYHNGSAGEINNGTGDFTIDSVGDIILDADGGDVILKDNGTQYAKLTNFLGGLAITSGGTNALIIGGTDGSMIMGGNVSLGDNKNLDIGNSSDLLLYHDATDSYILNATGSLEIRNTADDGDINFRSDNGSGGLTTYFALDGGDVVNRFYKDAYFTDNVKAKFGSSSDLQIYHDGSNSFIKNNTNDLYLDTASGSIHFTKNGTSEVMASFTTDGAVTLRYDNVTKLATKSDGVDITGELDADSLAISGNAVISGNLTVNGTSTTLNVATLDVEDKNITLNKGSGDTSGSANGAGITIQDAVNSSEDATILWNSTDDDFDFSHGITLPDDKKLQLGANNDLKIYHDPNNSFILHNNTSGYFKIGAGTNSLFLHGNRVDLRSETGNETMLQAFHNGAVKLYYDTALKLETTSTGVEVNETYNVASTNTTTSATTQATIDTFTATAFRSCRYTVQVTNSTDSTYHTTELLLVHDGTTPGITEFGSIFTGAAAEATFDADISSGSVRLRATPASTDSMTFKVVRHAITT